MLFQPRRSQDSSQEHMMEQLAAKLYTCIPLHHLLAAMPMMQIHSHGALRIWSAGLKSGVLIQSYGQCMRKLQPHGQPGHAFRHSFCC